MGVDFDMAARTTIRLERKQTKTVLKNDKGLVLEFEKLNDSTIILAMLHQTLLARLHEWENVSNNFSIELTIHEIVK